MAPVFRESLQAIGLTGDCSRKMFQKPWVTMSPSFREMSAPGDFYLQPNIDLTQEVLTGALKNKGVQDLVYACMDWYKKPPKPIRQEGMLLENDGTAVKMKTSKLLLSGTW